MEWGSDEGGFRRWRGTAVVARDVKLARQYRCRLSEASSSSCFLEETNNMEVEGDVVDLGWDAVGDSYLTEHRTGDGATV